MALVRRRRRSGTKKGMARKTQRGAYSRGGVTRRRKRGGTTKKGMARKGSRRAYAKRRKNPQPFATQIIASLSPGYKKQYKSLRARGFTTNDAFAEIEKTRKRRAKSKKKKRGTKRKTRKKAKRRGPSKARLRSWRNVAKAKVRRTGKITKGRKTQTVWGGRGKRAIAKASLTAAAAHRRRASGRMKTDEAKFLASTGLRVRRNPSLAATFGDLKTLAPMIGATAASVVGFTVLGNKVSKMLSPNITGAPSIIKNNITPITTFTLTAIVWTALKTSKMSKWSLPVLLGGTSAAILQWMISSNIGRELGAKLGYNVKETKTKDLEPGSTPAQAEAAVANDIQDAQKDKLGAAEWGMGSYVPVSQYMGGYVDAGPSEAFGEYMASNYPIHSPGPGDNRSVHGEMLSNQTISGYGGLGDYEDTEGGWDDTTQRSGIYDSRLPSVSNTLLDTPGGTIITGGEFQDNTASGEMLGEGVLAGSDRW